MNLTTVSPNKGQVIGLDTNVLFWLGYGPATQDPTVRERSRPYIRFVAKALNAGVEFQCTTLSLIEAMHKIELTEFKIANPGASRKLLKNFREVQSNRDLVADQIDAFWATMKRTASVLPATIDESVVPRMLSNQRFGELDAYDMGIIESCDSARVRTIITDDRDFATYDSGVIVVTANVSCLRQAAEQGKLVPLPTEQALVSPAG